MKRLMDESDGSTVEGLVVDDGGGASPPSTGFPIVGVGASAGGLEAFTQLLKHLPADSGMAFVLIQHLDPTHASFLRDALAKATTMTVSQAEDGTAVEPNHVYVIPPDADISIHGGRLTLASRTPDASTVAPVRRRLPPLARRGARQPRDRRRAFGKRLRRHRGPAGHQGGERHHVRAGSGFGEVRRDAAQRGQRRRRRRRAGDPRARARAGAPEPPPLRRSRRGPARDRRRRRPQSDPDGRTQRGRRRLRRVQARDGRAPAGPQDGGPPYGGRASLPGPRCKREPEEVARAL